MSMNPDELVSFANTFSNRTSGPMVKKKSAAQRRRAKAKGMNNAAAIALGQPMGKKIKPATSAHKGTKTTKVKTGNGIASVPNVPHINKPVTLGNKATLPYLSSGVVKAISDSKAKAAGMVNAAAVALGSPMKKQPSAGSLRAADYKNAAYVALGSQAKASPKKTSTTAQSAKTTKVTKMTPKVTTGNGPSKLSPSRASSR